MQEPHLVHRTMVRACRGVTMRVNDRI